MSSSRRAALIVEDQPFVGMVASDILNEAGFDTFHAYDAEAAAQLLDEHPEIEVMVTEALLPGGMNGLELCHQVAAERPHMQLVITAASVNLQGDDLPSGTRVLRKPYASGELRALVADRVILEEA